jgi:hypothetical protein
MSRRARHGTTSRASAPRPGANTGTSMKMAMIIDIVRAIRSPP